MAFLLGLGERLFRSLLKKLLPDGAMSTAGRASATARVPSAGTRTGLIG
jgi:hypothetical protein